MRIRINGVHFMRFLTHQYTNPGGREPNEDSAGSFVNGSLHAWIAADGLGGHSHGELASSKAVETLGTALDECTALDEEFIRNTFRKMNEEVKTLSGPLTTVAAGFSDGETLWYGNNGDSRFILIRNKKVLCRSNDHSLAFMAYKSGDISYEEISSHPAQNRLYHSLGFEIEFDGEFYPPVKLQPEDAFMVCTDGFWELINENEIIRALNISKNPQEWIDSMLLILKERLQSTSDNYTAVCVIVKKD